MPAFDGNSMASIPKGTQTFVRPSKAQSLGRITILCAILYSSRVSGCVFVCYATEGKEGKIDPAHLLAYADGSAFARLRQERQTSRIDFRFFLRHVQLAIWTLPSRSNDHWFRQRHNAFSRITVLSSKHLHNFIFEIPGAYHYVVGLKRHEFIGRQYRYSAARA